MAYESGTHALKQLIILREYGGRITRFPETIITLRGDLYYFVEIASIEGTRYVIEAYGAEAIELRREVLYRKMDEEIIVTAG